MSADRYGWAAQRYRPGHAGRMVTEVLWESELDHLLRLRHSAPLSAVCRPREGDSCSRRRIDRATVSVISTSRCQTSAKARSTRQERREQA
jgi:hypothetical protein